MQRLSDPKVKFLKLMPQSDATKVRRAKRRQVPQGLIAVQAKKDSTAQVMRDFAAKGEQQTTMEGFVPGASVFFVEARADPLSQVIPKHTLTPYFAVMCVEEWSANSTAGCEYSYHVWSAGSGRDASAPRLWSSMISIMTEVGMEWSAAISRWANKLQIGVNGQHNADAMESGVVAMAQHLCLLIKRTGAQTPLGDADANELMSDSSALSGGGMDAIFVTQLEPWLLAAQVRALLIESLAVSPAELGSISRMRWIVEDRGTMTWRVSVRYADSHEGTVILTEDCAYRVLSREHYAHEKQRQQRRAPTGGGDTKTLVCYRCGKEGHCARECPQGRPGHPPETTPQAKTTYITPRRSGMQAQRTLLPEGDALGLPPLAPTVASMGQGTVPSGTWTTVGRSTAARGSSQGEGAISVADVMRLWTEATTRQYQARRNEREAVHAWTRYE